MVALDGTWLNMVMFVWIAITTLVVVAEGKQRPRKLDWLCCDVV